MKSFQSLTTLVHGEQFVFGTMMVYLNSSVLSLVSLARDFGKNVTSAVIVIVS